MAWPVTFAALSTVPLSDLDTMFNAAGALTVIPCSATGTNALSLSPLANTPTIGGYFNYQLFSGVCAGANTGAATAAAGGLEALNIYKDIGSGPVALSGGELQTGNAFILMFDSALDSGAGGYHLFTQPLATPLPLASGSPVTANAGTTITASALTGGGTGNGIIVRGGTIGSGFVDVTDNATNIVAALPSPQVGTLFRFLIENQINETATLTADSGVSIVRPATISGNGSHSFWGQVYGVGSPTVTIYG